MDEIYFPEEISILTLTHVSTAVGTTTEDGMRDRCWAVRTEFQILRVGFIIQDLIPDGHECFGLLCCRRPRVVGCLLNPD